MMRIISKELPFIEDVHLPQKTNFKHSNKEFSVEYRRNSKDGSLFIRIIDIERDKLLLSCRVMEGSRYDVKNEDGELYFSLVPKNIENDIDIRIIDDESIIHGVE